MTGFTASLWSSASVCLSVVLWAAGCAAPCCPPAHTDTVGQRLCAAETGASVPELGEQTVLTARHRQPAGGTFILFKPIS